MLVSSYIKNESCFREFIVLQSVFFVIAKYTTILFIYFDCNVKFYLPKKHLKTGFAHPLFDVTSSLGVYLNYHHKGVFIFVILEANKKQKFTESMCLVCWP